MIIPEQFYEPEVRDGFYVPSQMKRYWAAMITVLEQIDRICRNHGLKFFADYGTLIGAVRHGGYIPWDDDFDISMLREDYMVFLKVAEKELPPGYKVLSIYNDHRSHTFLARVVNYDLISTEAGFLRANHNCPYATGVDIFPIDHFEYDDGINEYRKLLISGFDQIADMVDEEETDINNLPEEVRERIDYLCNESRTRIENGKYIKQQLLIMSDRLAAVFDKDATHVCHSYFWERRNFQIYPKEYYANTVMLPFEYTYIPAPVAYDSILTECYGPAYITPVRSGGVHDYPLYSVQREYMREAVGRVYYPEYVFSDDDLKRQPVAAPQRDRKEMVFLPFSPKYWKFMEKEWAKYAESPEWDVYVIPIPYYTKKEYNGHDKVKYDVIGYPEYVSLTAFDKYDFDTRLPERIVIQNPYDDYDSAISVHPRFYTDLLKQITQELVYIPYFATDDYGTDDQRSVIVSSYFIRVPGVTRADKVILFSDNMRARYIEELTAFAGEDTRTVWEERITADPSIAPDEECIGLLAEDVPGDWWKYLTNEAGEGIKVLLYHVNPGTLVVYGQRYFDKMDRVFEILAPNRDQMTVLWHMSPEAVSLLQTEYPDLGKKLREKIEWFKQEEMGIYLESDVITKAVAVADAYYGDRDNVMYRVMKLGKPVMIQNVEI